MNREKQNDVDILFFLTIDLFMFYFLFCHDQIYVVLFAGLNA